MRSLKNPAEQLLLQQLTAEGWYVTKRGWPDFACFKDDKLALIEVKPDQNHHLKRDQYRLMAALAKVGVECFRWSPDGGFEPITPISLDLSHLEKRRMQGRHRLYGVTQKM